MTRPVNLTRAIALTTLLWAGPLLASETVLLSGGQVLEAETVEFLENAVRVTLEGGGVLLLPLESVDSVLREPEPMPAAPEGPTGQKELLRAAEAACDRHGVDPTLVAALIQVESGWNPSAISEAGACGLMQLLPETARDYGVDDVFDPRSNLEAGVRHLRRLLDRYDNDHTLALAAYNAGEGRVDRYRGVPPFSETRDYVRRITHLVAHWRPDG